MAKLTSEQLNLLEKDTLITLYLSLQDQLDSVSKQLSLLTEQVMLMNQRTHGRKSEASEFEGQLSIFEAFNEAEYSADPSIPEPSISEITVSRPKKTKPKGKREADLKGLPCRIFDHTLSEEQLKAIFPDGYKELPYEQYKRLYVIPQTFIVDEHHVHIYVDRKDSGIIVRADRPADLFRNSVATPALVASILNGKYVNHLPVDRQSRMYHQYGINLNTNTLCNWIIKSSEDYLKLIYDELHKRIKDFKVLHADETPCQVTKDGRLPGSKSYMWVYCSDPLTTKQPVILYDYQLTRKTDHPREFLKDFTGTLVTDGYQVYHTIDKERKDLSIAGCWIHARRGFLEVTKALGEERSKGTIAKEAADRITKIMHLDNSFDSLSPVNRKKQRQTVLKPLVDDLFAWFKEIMSSMAASGKTASSIQCCLNQEQFLRLFLDNGRVPMDNNAALCSAYFNPHLFSSVA